MAIFRGERDQEAPDCGVGTTTEGRATAHIAQAWRFTEEEKTLLARAAAYKGWSPNNLIRIAALESAAAIVNTSTQTTFKGLALKLAEQLAKPRFSLVTTCDLKDPEDTSYRRMAESELAEPGTISERETIVEVEPETRQLSPDIVAEINKAAKYGSVEFLRPFIEYNEGLAAPSRLDISKLMTIENPE